MWGRISSGLLTFLGFLAAALVQVMPVTANFLQSDRLTPTEAGRLSEALTRQQRYWIGLLTATVVAFVVVIAASAFPLDANTVEVSLPRIGPTDLAPLISAIVAFVISFVFVKMFGLFEGVLSLQHLRSELVMAAAKRQAADEAKQLESAIDLKSSVVPADYGQIIRPH